MKREFYAGLYDESEQFRKLIAGLVPDGVKLIRTAWSLTDIQLEQELKNTNSLYSTEELAQELFGRTNLGTSRGGGPAQRPAVHARGDAILSGRPVRCSDPGRVHFRLESTERMKALDCSLRDGGFLNDQPC